MLGHVHWASVSRLHRERPKESVRAISRQAIDVQSQIWSDGQIRKLLWMTCQWHQGQFRTGIEMMGIISK